MSQIDRQKARFPAGFYALALLAGILLYWPPILVARVSGSVGPQGPEGKPGTFPPEAIRQIAELKSSVESARAEAKTALRQAQDVKEIFKLDYCIETLKMEQREADIYLQHKIGGIKPPSAGLSAQKLAMHRGILQVDSDAEAIVNKCLPENRRPNKHVVTDEDLDRPIENEPADQPNTIRMYRRGVLKARFEKFYIDGALNVAEDLRKIVRQRLAE